MDSGNIFLRSDSVFRIGSATATDDGDKFKVSGLELSDESLTLNNLTVKEATFNSNDGVVSFTDKNGETLDIAAKTVKFGEDENKATMQVENNQVVFKDKDGTLIDIGDPIVGDLTMPLDVYDSGAVKFSISSNNDITILNTADDAFEMNKSLFVNGIINADGDVTIGKVSQNADLTVHGSLEVNGNTSLEVYSNTTTNSKMNINVHNVSDLQDNHSIPVLHINNADNSDIMVSCDVIKNSSEAYTANEYFRIYGESAGLVLQSDHNIVLESNTAINSDLTVNGDTTIGSSTTNADLTVNGSTTIESNLTVNGDINTNASLTVNGSVYVDHLESNGTVNVNGDAQFDQKLTVDGNLVSNNTSSLTFKSTGEEDIVMNYAWLKNILDRLTALENNNN